MGSLPRNILEQQGVNKRTTLLVMLVFVLFFAVLGYLCDVFFLGMPIGRTHSGGIGLPIITLLAVAFAGINAWSGFVHGSASVLRSAGAEPVVPGDPSCQQLLNVVGEMSIASGLPQPSVFVIPDPDPNAFATGRNPGEASIAVTQGLIEKLNREELQAVIAHEISHVRNYDTRLMTVVAALIGATMLLSEFGLRSFRLGGGRSPRSSRDRNGVGGLLFFLIWLLAMLLAPAISQILAMAVSRQREYLADASAAELTRNPLALASALATIDAADDPTRSIKKGSAHLCIADPLGREVNEREGFLANLFATHPPIQKRILALRAMAYQHA